MDKNEIYWKVRNLMSAEGIWPRMMNFKIYTAGELITEIGAQNFSDELKTLLTKKVSRLQFYLDDRIIELKN